MRKKKRYNFIEKRYAKGGKLSFVLSLVAIILMLLCVLSAVTHAEGVSMTGGAVAVISLLFALYAFIKGLRSFSDTEGSPLFSIIGTITSGVVLVVWLTLFLAGLR